MQNFKKKKSKNYNDSANKERLNSLEEITDTLMNRYLVNMPYLKLFFAIKRQDGFYFIFQEINSFPISLITFGKTNSSISITANWFVNGALPYLNGGKVLELKSIKAPKYVDASDIPVSEQEKLLHAIINKSGDYNKSWLYKQLDGLNKMEAATTIRIENINRVYLYKEYFEIFSDELCLLGMCDTNIQFPFVFVNPIETNGYGQHFVVQAAQAGQSFDVNKQKLFPTDSYIYYWEDAKFLKPNDGFEDAISEELETGRKVIVFNDVGQSFRKINIEDD